MKGITFLWQCSYTCKFECCDLPLPPSPTFCDWYHHNKQRNTNHQVCTLQWYMYMFSADVMSIQPFQYKCKSVSCTYPQVKKKVFTALYICMVNIAKEKQATHVEWKVRKHISTWQQFQEAIWCFNFDFNACLSSKWQYLFLTRASQSKIFCKDP